MPANNTARDGAVRLASSALAVLAALALAACGGGDDIGRTVDATVTLDLPDSIPLGAPFDIGYTWTPSTDFQAPPDDYRIFVHLVDPDGNIVAQDDHYPPLPTTQWAAGQPVSYRLWVYPDPDLRPDYFDLYVGMYDEEGQIGTRHEGRFQNRPLVHSVIVRADEQGGVPVYLEGFEERETSLTVDDALGRQWQWMRENGTVAFGNPRGAATLHLRALSPVDFLEGRRQQVTIRSGETVIASFEATDSSPYLMRFDVPADAWGEGEWVDIVVEVDKTFVPAQIEEGSSDVRELGLQVFWMYLQRQQ